MPRSKVELFAATRQGSPFLPSPDRCRYQSRRRRGPGISGKMFSAPGLLARVERSGGRVRWRPKRSCCPWTPTISTAALLDTQRQRRVLGRERAGRVWATLASTSTRDGQPFKAHPQGWLMYVAAPVQLPAAGVGAGRRALPAVASAALPRPAAQLRDVARLGRRADQRGEPAHGSRADQHDPQPVHPRRQGLRRPSGPRGVRRPGC